MDTLHSKTKEDFQKERQSGRREAPTEGHRARAGPRVRRAETCGVMSAIIITTGFDANDKVSDPPGNNNFGGVPDLPRVETTFGPPNGRSTHVFRRSTPSKHP